ncbi:rhomboid family intramembrane serine protease [Candidatus Pacearchaeota archaeon]|nr:rhomboid family intramembrane serine protease [Candidatus Pacearchaeota archaeon]
MARRSNASITLILIIITVAVFLITMPILYVNQDYIKYFALKPSVIIHGQYVWTVVTNIFMHAGVGHLFMNMISLIFLGGFLEKIIGKRRFLLFYLIAGIFASLFFILTSVIFNTDMDVYAVGASGAIFGIAGLVAVLTPKLPVYIMFIPIATPMWLAVIIILGLMWFISIIAGLPIGNTAHLGGLVCGLIYGFYIRTKYGRKVRLLNRMLAGK